MGLTNFHSPTQLLARSTGTKHQHEVQAMIQEFGRPVYVNYTPFSQETIDQYSWRLEYCHLDQWASPAEDAQHPVTNTKTPDPVRIPRLCISPSLKPPPYSVKDDLAAKVDYIFLVEGNRGANLKLVLQRNHHDAGFALFNEAMNGYSVVFSAAIPKTHSKLFLIEPQHRVWDVIFKKVESMEELLGGPFVNLDPNSREVVEVRVLC